MHNWRQMLEQEEKLIRGEAYDINAIDYVVAEVSDKIAGCEESAEEILTAAINVEHSSEILDAEVESLKRLIDNLRKYNKKLDEVRKHLKEADSLI